MNTMVIFQYHGPVAGLVFRFLMAIMTTNEEFVWSSRIQVQANHMAAHGSMLNLITLWGTVDFTQTPVTVAVLA